MARLHPFFCLLLLSTSQMVQIRILWKWWKEVKVNKIQIYTCWTFITTVTWCWWFLFSFQNHRCLNHSLFIILLWSFFTTLWIRRAIWRAATLFSFLSFKRDKEIILKISYYPGAHTYFFKWRCANELSMYHFQDPYGRILYQFW